MSDLPTHRIDLNLDLRPLTAEIVSAYVSKNLVSATSLPEVIASTFSALAGLGQARTAPAAPAEPEFEKASPAAVRKSITPDALISFVDGAAYKTLKRHLGTHGLTPEGYRARYGLPHDYPMVAPNYAAQRSALAKASGLGRPGARAEQQAA